jgi:diguanylate cyclase (GGDEF)-like protein
MPQASPAERRGAVRVVLADEHPTVRRILRMVLELEDGFAVVAEANSLESAVLQARRHRPHVLLLAPRAADGPGIESVRRARRGVPGTVIVVLTMDDNAAFAVRALRAGASGLVLKDTADAELPEAVRCAAQGDLYMSPRVTVRSSDATRSDARDKAQAGNDQPGWDQVRAAVSRERGENSRARAQSAAELEREINRARHANGRLVLAVLAIDRLKGVRDRRDPETGDGLRHVLATIQTHVRSYDPIIPLGGDEFVCALTDCTPEEARSRFGEIQAAIRRDRPTASVSVGFAALRAGDSLEQLIERGDKALCEARHTGSPAHGIAGA